MTLFIKLFNKQRRQIPFLEGKLYNEKQMKRNRSQRKVNMYYMEFQLLEVLSVNNIPQKFAFSNEH
jgi:hypothetical protein